MSTRGDAAEAALWIFGYGSLMWRPAFAHAERRPALLEDWARRFWQGSTDHRGVPGAPGRVVTLVPTPEARCWGMAFRVEPAHRRDVLERLDHRERGGFERHEVEVRLAEHASRVAALTYVAFEGNPNFLGPAPLQAVAAQVQRSQGPSGSNAEYVVELARTLRELDADDPHVFAVERLVRARSRANGDGLQGANRAARGRPSGDP